MLLPNVHNDDLLFAGERLFCFQDQVDQEKEFLEWLIPVFFALETGSVIQETDRRRDGTGIDLT